ncbi:MAG: excinuclease ABC subunit C [Syntrophobacteraceae bacterium CG07_land_8_20_14_0_80_61_8]|nr:MAG: excinuclease ABC subunit C [Syntrophobacteraceae bacterium CG07_land_8_20_14_0_80_61_8]
MDEREQPPAAPNGDDSVSSEPHPCHGKALNLPHLPGVYLFQGRHREVLYVGKARDLRKRVLSYFRTSPEPAAKTRVLLERATDLEVLVTSTEKEALLLESSLIKKHRPRYNVLLRDDKNYPALRIDPREPYPRLQVVRRFHADGAQYFGPYASPQAVRDTLKLLQRMFPLRQCKGQVLRPRPRPCLNFSLGRCLGACAGKVSRAEYQHMVEQVILFLRGKTDLLQRQLRERMEAAAARLDFEQAAQYRDRLRVVSATLEQQHIISSRFIDQDVLGTHLEPARAILVVLFVRHGAMVGQRTFEFTSFHGDRAEVLSAFIQQFYREGRLIPDEILVPESLEAQDLLQECLAEQRGKRVLIRPAQRGNRRMLLELAAKNAEQQSTGQEEQAAKVETLLAAMQTVLHLPRPPRHLACVDISNIQGRHAVGSMVRFTNAAPDYPKYRRYTVKEQTEPDDPAMMAEVVQRFLERDRELAAELDLLVLDGGKTQLNRIQRLLIEAGLEQQLPLIALAKEQETDRGDEGRGMYEKVYLPGRKNPLFLTRHPAVLHLLQHLRDEAHRCAVSFYQKRHRQDLLMSSLDAIPGIGEKRRRLLLQHLGSLDALRQAAIHEIAAVPGISEQLAGVIFDHLHRPLADPDAEA